MPLRPLPIFLLRLLLAAQVPLAGLQASWLASTTGHPAVETVYAKDIGGEGSKNIVREDALGRLYIGTNRLIVFDGQSWLSYPLPNSSAINDLALGQDGKVWIGAENELGYFQESATGVFDYHSLVSHLPSDAKDVGTVWGCGQVDALTYFICQKKILRWDGSVMQAIPMATATRLGPLKLGDELWIHHLETGLYRLTAQGPQLEIPARDLPHLLIIGLFRDQQGLVTISNQGFIRPGKIDAPFSQPALNQYLGNYRVSAFTELPDERLAIGTLSGGLVLANRSGQLLQTWTSHQGLPGRGIHGLSSDRAGNILGTTSTDFFHLPTNGIATVFNTRNGLSGETVNHLMAARSQLHAVTEDGSYVLDVTSPPPPHFTALPGLTERYHHVVPYRDGLMLSRFGGADFFDGKNLQSIYRVPANWTNLLLPSRLDPRRLYAAEAVGLAALTEQADGSWTRTLLVELPDPPTSLFEDPTGCVWIGTATRGAFSFNPTTAQLTPLPNPQTQKPFTGRVIVSGNPDHLLFFADGLVFVSAPEGGNLRQLLNIPTFNPQVVYPLPHESSVFIAMQRSRGADAESPGFGLLSFGPNHQTEWRELDLPEAQIIGTIRTATLAQDDHESILWLGGTTGILRVDYEKIPTLLAPAPPVIRLANPAKDFTHDPAAPVFNFTGHRVKLAVFSNGYVPGKHLLVQTRLENGDWSGLSSRRSFEFTNLSEGVYHFEARLINTANMASAPARFTFTILPPWYRSGPAYALYAVGMLLFFFGYIRVRERRIRARNQALEKTVAQRTAELVKANAAKDEFLASVSHEIRNPMNGVIGIAETFPTETLDGESQRKFNLLRQCASHLSSLLEDILDFSRVQAGAIDLEEKSFEVRDLVLSISAMTASESEKRGIPVEIAVSPAVPAKLRGDPRRIRQILLNFVSNALKFSGRGQVSVTVWCKSGLSGKTEVIFAISDEGPGISPEEQKKLFHRFERGAAAEKGRVPGTGLGLALCKALAEKMGGRIWLESEIGRGSCFYFSAPFAIDDTPPDDDATRPAAAEIQRSYKTALVVDDEEYNRISLADLLDAQGIAVQTAADGFQALAFAELQDFDVIFLDYDLPGMNGLEIARALRALPCPTARAVILATTAFTTPDKQAKCLAAGMNAFLAKPVTKERLLRALQAPTATAPAFPSKAVESAPTDRLANLRLLATKKQISFAEELALYFSELEVELDHLHTAVAQEDAAQSGHYAHLLYGRCAFIYERELEQTLRQIESAAATGQWPETQPLLADVRRQLAALRSRLIDAPTVPPASDH